MVDLYGDDKGNRLIGAAEKRLRAQKYNTGSKFGSFSSSSKKAVSPTIAVALTFVVSCALALLLTDGPIVMGLPFKIHPALDAYLFGPGNPEWTGTAATDRLIAILLRGGAIFAFFGIAPLVTNIWQTWFNKQNLNAHVAVWLTTVMLALLGYLFLYVL